MFRLVAIELQAQVASLERSLQEEKERHRSERIRRKEIHNTLIVSFRKYNEMQLMPGKYT